MAQAADTPAADLVAWIGRRATASDVIDVRRVNALRVAIGQAGDLAHGDALPLLHHWLHFWDVRRPEETGSDGHPMKGGFLPPVPLPRRMWAGGRVRFLAPLRLGDQVERVSTIGKVAHKSGKSGDLVFVTVEHRLTGPAGLAIVEQQDLVYRSAGSAVAPVAADPSGRPSSTHHRRLQPDPVLLFRFSALTMNSHRIHYDLPYATGEEGYPQLVVHGPLQAILMADLGARHLGAPVHSFAFRGQAPAYAGAPLDLCADPVPAGLSLWSEQLGNKAMIATIEADIEQSEKTS